MNFTAANPLRRPLFWAACIIFIGFHIYNIAAPPNGYHQWRESDTAAVIMNYYQEDISFLHPRINQRGDASGITGSELPVYSYTAALLYFVTGPSHVTARLLTLLAALVGLWLFYLIVSTFSGERAAGWAVWGMAFSPLFFFYGYKIMPDIWMLTFLLAAVYLFTWALRNNRSRFWVWSAVCLIVSATIKPLGLSVYLLFLYLVRTRSERRPRDLAKLTLYVVTTFTLVLGWYLYGRSVNAANASPGFYMGELLWTFPHYLQTSQFYKKLFLQWPWELWIGWTLVPAFVYGLYSAIRRKNYPVYLVWILASYLVFALIAGHSSSHDYYTLIIVPPLAAISGLALDQWWFAGRWRRYLVILLVVAAPAVTFARVWHRLDDAGEFYDRREAAGRLIPRQALVMVEDSTPAAVLYQLNLTGWPFRFEITYDEVKNCIDRGARYLVLKQPLENYNDSLTVLFDAPGFRLGDLYCYRAKN